ncbi:hypothetical protein HanIR_Chr03g0108061 [Helianthus annuus]|nr:hypothetical protein HanIR_Chr03g0108061 [Helianthus annuus]
MRTPKTYKISSGQGEVGLKAWTRKYLGIEDTTEVSLLVPVNLKDEILNKVGRM